MESGVRGSRLKEIRVGFWGRMALEDGESVEKAVEERWKELEIGEGGLEAGRKPFYTKEGALLGALLWGFYHQHRLSGLL